MEVRGLRLQQVALGRLCADLVPDRLAQGVSPDRVPGRHHVFRHGRHRQGADLLPRRPGQRRRGAAAGREPLGRFEPVADKHTGRVSRRAPCATAWARSRAQGRARSRKSCGRKGRRPVPEPVRLLPPCQQAFGQPAHHRGADQGGRLRWHRATARRHAGLGAHGHGGRAGRAQRQPGFAVRRRQRRRGGRRAGQGRALGPAQEAHRGKIGAGLLLQRPPVRRLARRSAPHRAHAAGAPGAAARRCNGCAACWPACAP